MKKFIHKKSLGQNFLKNDAVIARIVESAEIGADDVVLEIGPGQGVLTESLAEKAQKVLAIELDDRLISVLRKRFEDRDNVEIIHDDVLHMNVDELLEKHALLTARYKLVANIPYYITAPIIRLFLELAYPPEEIVLMVQKEVAERITARPGAMSVLAVSAQYYADVEYLFTVPREDFDPVPAVDSAVVKLKRKNEELETVDVKSFFRVVKIGFSARRKTLVNNLSAGYHKDKKEVATILSECDIDAKARAQELSLDQWKALAERFGE